MKTYSIVLSILVIFMSVFCVGQAAQMLELREAMKKYAEIAAERQSSGCWKVDTPNIENSVFEGDVYIEGDNCTVRENQIMGSVIVSKGAKNCQVKHNTIHSADTTNDEARIMIIPDDPSWYDDRETPTLVW